MIQNVVISQKLTILTFVVKQMKLFEVAHFWIKLFEVTQTWMNLLQLLYLPQTVEIFLISRNFEKSCSKLLKFDCGWNLAE